MDRDTAVALAQNAIKAKNKKLINAILEIQGAREPCGGRPVEELPLVGVTCATGWECYAVVAELVKTRRFRVRAMYRTPGTQAAERLRLLLRETEAETPGLLTLRPHTNLNSKGVLTDAFEGCSGLVLYVTANTSRAGKITNHGNDPVGGRAAVMRQVTAIAAAIRATPSVEHAVTLVFPTDKVRGIVANAPRAPWWVEQRLLIPDFLRDRGINVTCIHRPAYYFAMHRIDYRDQLDIRGQTAMARTMIKENCMPGILEPDYVANWVDVRDVGRWVGTVLEYPAVFANADVSIASSVMTGNQRAETAKRINKHGTPFQYRKFPMWLMKTIALFNQEVIYPLRYAQWYNTRGNAFDFATNEDLADLAKIHPPWDFENKLRSWGIDELRPKGAPPAPVLRSPSQAKTP